MWPVLLASIDPAWLVPTSHLGSAMSAVVVFGLLAAVPLALLVVAVVSHVRYRRRAANAI